MSDAPADLAALVDAIRRFESARDWARYHSPKNLLMALAAEVGELLEPFRWRSEAESEWAALPAEVQAEVCAEIGDVVILLLNLCDRLGVDPVAAARDKLAVVAQRYPVDKAYGKAHKYTAYEDPDE